METQPKHVLSFINTIFCKFQASVLVLDKLLTDRLQFWELPTRVQKWIGKKHLLRVYEIYNNYLLEAWNHKALKENDSGKIHGALLRIVRIPCSTETKIWFTSFNFSRQILKVIVQKVAW